MFSKKTLAAAAVALSTIGAAQIATTSAAEAAPRWRPVYGWGLAAGVLGGVALGAALSRPAYAEPVAPVYGEPPRRECAMVERVNRWGEVIGVRRVCRVLY